MKSSEKKLLFIEVFMIIMLIINLFFLQANNFILSIFIIAMFFISIVLLGYENDRHRFKKDGILLSVIFALIYEILTYLSGLYVGFLRSSYSLTLFGIIQNMIPFLLVVVTGEILRYEFVTKGEKKALFYVLTLIVFILLDVSANIYTYDLNSTRVIVEVICVIGIPSIAKNFLLTYWMRRFGILANVIYLSITSLVIFVVPILPNFNKYLQAVIALIYPIILFFITRKILKDEAKHSKLASKTASRIMGLAAFMFTLVLVVLTSGIFKYYFLTIGSGSMEKELYVGDVVIVKKLNLNEIKEIEVGTIIVFRMQNKIIVHRVVEIDKIDGSFIFKTKGDNNEERDNWVVTENNLIGLTKHKIPYVGLPSIWLYEFVEGSKIK